MDNPISDILFAIKISPSPAVEAGGEGLGWVVGMGEGVLPVGMRGSAPLLHFRPAGERRLQAGGAAEVDFRVTDL